MRSRAKINTSLFIIGNLHEIESVGGWANQIYAGLALNRSGDRAQAEAMFRLVLNIGPQCLKPRAALALGSNAFQTGDLDAAIRLYQVAQSGDSLTALLGNLNSIAVMGITGEHRYALRALEALESAVLAIGRVHPVVVLNWLNSLSVELMSVGKIEQAKRAFTFVQKSPVQLPWWKETKAELDAATPRGVVQIPTAYNDTARCQRANLRLQRRIYRAQGNAPLLEDYAGRLER